MILHSSPSLPQQLLCHFPTLYTCNNSNKIVIQYSAMTPFWQICSDGLSCIRQEVFLVLETIILCFSIGCLIQLIKQLRGFKFEIVPITCNILSLLTILSITFFARDYEYYLAGYFIQIYTYSLFLYMFLSLRFKIYDNLQRTRLKLLYVWMAGTTLCVIALVILVFTKILSANCSGIDQTTFYASFGVESALFLATLWFGRKIISSMNQRNFVDSDEGQDFYSQLQRTQDEYILVRRRQVNLILFTFTLTMVARIVTSVLFAVYKSDYSCQNSQGINFLQAQSILGEVIICLAEAVTLIPNIILPIALYVIPSKLFKQDSSLEVNLEKESDATATVINKWSQY